MDVSIVILMLCSVFCVATAQTVCSRSQAVTTVYSYYVQTSYTYYYSCGFFGWSTCSGVGYGSNLQYNTQVTYYLVMECCSGYEDPAGGLNCGPICVDCDSNHVCTAPYTCVCPDGWMGDDCMQAICVDCDSNHVCTAPDICVCPEGWMGDDCMQAICVDCDSNHVCTAPDICVCPEGWMGDDCMQAICVDCDSNHVCTAPDICVCPEGWMGDDCMQAICLDCDSNHVCPAPYTCVCPDGWMGDDCMQAICVDCDSNHVCPAPYTCVCPDGWMGDDCMQAICVDCDSNHVCPAPYTCVCPDGWMGDDCMEDIDECADDTSGCEQVCINNNSSYTCACEDDYALALDLHSCLGLPLNVTLNATSSMSLHMDWEEPELDAWDGTVSGYGIECSSDFGYYHENTFGGGQREYDVYNLLPFSNYSCCVLAMTTNGNSKYSCDAEQTLQDTPHDIPQNISVNNHSAYALLIEWDPPLIPNGIITLYTIYADYYNGSGVAIDVSAASRSYKLEGLSPHQLVGINMSASTIIGEGPVSFIIAERTSQSVPSEVTNFQVIVISPNMLFASWGLPEYLNGILTGYEIEVYNIVYNISHSVFVPETETNATLSDIIEPFIPYTIEISAYTHAGKGITETLIHFSKEGVPTDVVITSAERTDAISFQLTWESLTLEELRGFLDLYVVTYAQLDTYRCLDIDPQTSQIASVEIPSIIISGLVPDKEYCVGVAAKTVESTGNYTQTLIPLYEHLLYQVHFYGIHDCPEWVHEDSLDKITDLINGFSIELSRECDCHIPLDHFSDERLICQPEDASKVVFQGRLVVTEDKNVSGLLDNLKQWVMTDPHVVVQGVQLSVDQYCSVEVTELGDSECVSTTEAPTDKPTESPTATPTDKPTDKPTDEPIIVTESKNETLSDDNAGSVHVPLAALAGSAAGILLVVVIILLATTCTAVLCTRRKKLPVDESRFTQPDYFGMETRAINNPLYYDPTVLYDDPTVEKGGGLPAYDELDILSSVID